MLRKIIIGAAASIAALVALPAAAQAQAYYGDPYYGRGHYGGSGYYGGSPYYGGYRHRYRPGDYYPVARHRRGYYGRGYYGRGYYGRGYGYNRGYYRGRCGDGTTGAIVGGAAGALVGREIDRSDGGRYGRYRGRDSGTTGAIVGGVVGALVGREIDRSC